MQDSSCSNQVNSLTLSSCNSNLIKNCRSCFCVQTDQKAVRTHSSRKGSHVLYVCGSVFVCVWVVCVCMCYHIFSYCWSHADCCGKQPLEKCHINLSHAVFWRQTPEMTSAVCREVSWHAVLSRLCSQEWLINEKKLDVFGMKLPTGFQLIGQVVCICSWDLKRV